MPAAPWVWCPPCWGSARQLAAGEPPTTTPCAQALRAEAVVLLPVAEARNRWSDWATYHHPPRPSPGIGHIDSMDLAELGAGSTGLLLPPGKCRPLPRHFDDPEKGVEAADCTPMPGVAGRIRRKTC